MNEVAHVRIVRNARLGDFDTKSYLYLFYSLRVLNR